MFPSSEFGESWERISTKVDSNGNDGLDKLLAFGGFRVGKKGSKPGCFTPVDNCEMKTGNQCQALVVFKTTSIAANVPSRGISSWQHLRLSTRQQRFMEAKQTGGFNRRAAIVSGATTHVEICWPLRDVLRPQESWNPMYQQRVLAITKSGFKTTVNKCRALILYTPVRTGICCRWPEVLRPQDSWVSTCRQQMVAATKEWVHPSGQCQELVLYRPCRIVIGGPVQINQQHLTPVDKIKASTVLTNSQSQVYLVPSTTPSKLINQSRIHNHTVINRQPLVHVLDPTLFCYALEHALQVPQYRRASSWLFNKYLGTDCRVERLTKERDDALIQSLVCLLARAGYQRL